LRADRLLAILLLLQNRGTMTAHDLAVELEVSERTIYRDIDALCIAGVPVYSESGHGGGYGLVDDYRTHLTGLNKTELRALMTLGSIAPISDLGMRSELGAALLKISAALPESSRKEDERIQQCFHFDSTWWQQRGSWTPHLQTVQDALWQARNLQIVYRPLETFEITRLVSPYGLVVKAGRWYLVYARNGSVFVRPISELLDVQLSEERFKWPEDFDLAGFWAEWCQEYEAFLVDFTVTLKIAPGFLPYLRRVCGSQAGCQALRADSTDKEGWVQLNVSFESFEAARDRILSFGRGVRVAAPRALQMSVLDYAEQIVKLYQGK
jgi:predicted DNA-binding transcriptional regulator YafY